MRKINKLWLSTALVVGIVALCATGFSAYKLCNFELTKPQRIILPTNALRDLPKSTSSTISVASLQIPATIAPQVYSLVSGIGADEKDIGFILYWDSMLYENADKFGREVAVIGISSGDYAGSIIIQSPKGAVVASPRGLYTPDPPLWQMNFTPTLEVVKKAYDALGSDKIKVLTDESFKIDFKKQPIESDLDNHSPFVSIKWHKVGYDRDGNSLNSIKDFQEEVGGLKKEELLEWVKQNSDRKSKLFEMQEDGQTSYMRTTNPQNTKDVLLWGHGNKTYELSSQGLSKFEAHIDSVIKIVYASYLLPFAPPLLHLAILLGIFIVLMLVFIFGRFHDFALSSFCAFLTILLAGGASIMLDGRMVPEIVVITSLIGSGIAWTVPVLLFSVSIGLDLAIGWYWFFFALLSASNILAVIFPKNLVWISLEILLGFIALSVFISYTTRKNKKTMV